MTMRTRRSETRTATAIRPGMPLHSALAAASLLLAAALLLPGKASGQGVGLALGTPAPEAELEDLDGNPVQLLDYVEPGKPTLIEIWASAWR